MSILAQVTQGAGPVGQRIIIAAAEGKGKTTLAAGAPGALLVPLAGEEGIPADLDVPRTPVLQNWQQIEQFQTELYNAARPGSTIVWDSATALERIIHETVIMLDPKYKNDKSLTMETSHDGYGKAYPIANDYFARFTRFCDALRLKGVNTVLTCHVFSSRVIDPASGEYDTWDLLLHSPKNNKNYGKREMATQWADMIGFVYEPVTVIKSKDAGTTMRQGISAGQGRVISVERTPAWVAKNRYGLSATPIALPKPGWNNIADAVWQSTQGRVDLWNRG